VYEIANTATSKGLGTQEEVTNFEVKMRIVDRSVKLRPGMSMWADIETDTKTNVLSVPIQSVTVRMPKVEMKEGGQQDQQAQQGGSVVATNTRLRDKREEKPREIVFVVQDGTAKAIPVKRGINDDSYVEIKEGVKDGDMVVSGSYKAINRELEDGSKVRVEEAKKLAGGAKPEGA
jgi:HlyD family secretion protein